MIWSQSERCERAREGNGCCVVWHITFYLLPPAAGCLATAPHHERSLGRGRVVSFNKTHRRL